MALNGRATLTCGKPALGLALTVALAGALFGMEPKAPSAAPGPSAQQGRAGGTPRTRPRTRPRVAPDAAPSQGTGGSRARGDDRGGSGGDALGLSGAGNPFGFPAEREQRRWFNIADADSTTWISFREAKGSMRFDAGRFRAYDRDVDGRITFAEFTEFIRNERALGRRVIEPIMADIDGRPPTRTAEQLRAAYDTDLDSAISQMELDRILGDYDRGGTRFDADTVLRRLDADGNGVLDVNELERMANYLMPLAIDPGQPRNPQPGARSVGELFGTPIDQGESQPPRILGPIHPFRRLDVNNDGYINMEDLERLEGRSYSPVSLKSVLNTLDVNFDGRVSEREFMASITPKRK